MSKSFKLVSKCVQKIEKYLLPVNKAHKPIILANPHKHTHTNTSNKMSQPFRIRVPSSTTTPSRRGRSLADITEQNEKEQKQRYNNRGGGRGRGRGRGGGRGRGYGRGRFNKRDEKKPKVKRIPMLKPGETGYFPVGSKEWAKLKAQQNPSQVFRSTILDDMSPEEQKAYAKLIPRLPGPLKPRKSAMSPTDAAISRGWEHHRDPIYGENDEIVRYDTYWSHPKYAPILFGNKEANVEEPRFQSGYVNWYGQRYEIPVENEHDTLGLAYRYEVSNTGNLKVIPNYWKSFWDTRRGKRHANYLDYLDYRKNKREEMEAAGVKLKKNY